MPVKKRTTKRKAAPKSKATVKKRKVAKPTTRAGKLKAEMKKKGLKLPHGYEVVVRKLTKKKPKKKRVAKKK